MNDQSDRTEYGVFRHLQADKALAYRAVLGVFVDARERFALHLKPAEVLARLYAEESGGVHCEEEREVEMLLVQLAEWGNLTAHADNSEVKTVEDFNRPRFLYQLSRAGEAAERALALFRETIEQPGALQATALAEITEGLRSLQAILTGEPCDTEKAFLIIRELFGRFEVLTSRAQMFMGSIQRVIDLQDADVTTFLRYKETLLDYIQRFIQELITKGAVIAQTLRSIPDGAATAALDYAGRRDLADAIDQSEEAAERSVRTWTRKWEGLKRWFVGEDGPSQAALLRARARSAIPDLLAVVSSLNERRTMRSDRAADYRALARWFAECPTGEDAHTLWRAAFCMTPVRHLALTPESLDENEDGLVAPRTRWPDAEPMWVSPRLRSTGWVRRMGRVAMVIDRTAGKEEILRRNREETRQILEARRRILSGQARRLSEFAALDRQAFALFLDCLGSALSRQVPGASSVEARSSDGTLRVRLERIEAGPLARVRTADGVFVGPDHWIHIEDAVPEASA